MSALTVTRTESFSMQVLTRFETDDWDSMMQHLRSYRVPEERAGLGVQFDHLEPRFDGVRMQQIKVIYRIDYNPNC